MCNRVAFGTGDQEVYKISGKTKLIGSGVIPTKGVRKQKVENTIGPRLVSFRCSEDGSDLANVLLFFLSDIDQILNDIRSCIAQTLP